MSKEARVECLFSYNLEDLGIVLVKGQVVWFDKVTYEGSESLKHAQAIGAVGVQWKNRAQAQREAQPPWLRRRGKALPPRKHKRPAEQTVQVPAPATPTVDVDRIRREAVQAAQEAAAKAAAAAARSAVMEALALRQESGGITQEQLEQALTKVQVANPQVSAPDPQVAELLARLIASENQLSSLLDQLNNQPLQQAVLPSAMSPVSDDDDDDDDDDSSEMFIPSGIVSEGSKSEIKIESSASADSNLDAAAEALKKAAPKRRRSRKRKTAKTTTDGDS